MHDVTYLFLFFAALAFLCWLWTLWSDRGWDRYEEECDCGGGPLGDGHWSDCAVNGHGRAPAEYIIGGPDWIDCPECDGRKGNNCDTCGGLGQINTKEDV